MNEITILVPNVRSPMDNSLEIVAIKNICKELNKYIKIKIIWCIINSNSIKTINDYKIIHFKDYKNAIELIDSVKPDLIFTLGELSCSSLIFTMSGKFKKIPIITLNLDTTVNEEKIVKITIKSRIKMLFSKNNFLIINSEQNRLNSIPLIFYSIQYMYLLKTLRKMNYGLLQILKFMLFYPRVQFFSKTMFPLHELTMSNCNLCGNIERANSLKKIGVNQKNIFLIGHPFFDELYEKIKNLTPSKTKKRILFCTSPMYEHNLWSKTEEMNFIKKIIKMIIQKNEFKIILKIHPVSSSLNEYKKSLVEFKDQIEIYQKEDLVDLINESDVIITYGGSSVIVYGILMKKNTIFIHKNSKGGGFFDESMVTNCKDVKDLLKCIESNYNSNKSFDKYIEDHLGFFDGKCSKRASKIILNFLNLKNIEF